MATQYGGSASRGFTSSQLRLGRTESLKEFAQVLQKQTTGRMRQTAEGIGRSAVSAALAPLPGPLQASMYGMLTSNPFGGGVSGDTESTVEKISDDVEDLKNPKWATNLMRLYREPLPVKIVEDRLGALEAKRESMIDITPTVEKVEEEDKEDEKKGFFGRLFDGFKNLFNFKGGLGNFLTKVMGGAGALALGALKFARGVGLVGLLGTIIFNDKIIEQLTKDFTKVANEDLFGVSETVARISTFLTENAQGGLKAAGTGAARWAMMGAGVGLLSGGLPGMLIGASIGAAFGGLLGFLGNEKVSNIIQTVVDWADKSWNQAMLGWEERNKAKLEKDLASKEKLYDQLISEGKFEEAGKLYSQIIQLRDDIHDAEIDIANRKIEISKEELEQSQRRKKEIERQRRIMELQNMGDDERAKMMQLQFENLQSSFEEVSKFANLPERIGLDLQQLKNLDFTDRESFIKVENMMERLEESIDSYGVKPDRKSIMGSIFGYDDEDYIDSEKRVSEMRLLSDLREFLMGKRDDTTQEEFNIRNQQQSFSGLLLSDPGFRERIKQILMSSTLKDKYIQDGQMVLGPDAMNPVALSELIKNNPELFKSAFDKVTESELETLQKKIDSRTDQLKKEQEEKEDLTGSLYFDPRETLEEPIQMIGKSVENMVAMNTPSSLPPVMSDFGNQSTVIEGSRNQYDTKVFNQIFQTDSDRMYLAGHV